MSLGKQMTLDEKIAAKASQTTDWDSDQSTWEYVTIPEENALGERHDSMSINNHVFAPGQTYKVPPKIAETLRDRLKVYARACVRILQPKRDVDAERRVAIGSASSAQAVEASTLANDFSGLNVR